MTNLINLNAEAGADFIGDDAEPAVTFKNTSTGPGMRLFGLVCTSTASLDRLVINGGTVAGEAACVIKKAYVGSQSVGILKLVGSSVASGAVIEFSNKSFISITSIKNDAAYTDYAIPVQVGLETRYIPCYQSGALNGGAAF